MEHHFSAYELAELHFDRIEKTMSQIVTNRNMLSRFLFLKIVSCRDFYANPFHPTKFRPQYIVLEKTQG